MIFRLDPDERLRLADGAMVGFSVSRAAPQW